VRKPLEEVICFRQKKERHPSSDNVFRILRIWQGFIEICRILSIKVLAAIRLASIERGQGLMSILNKLASALHRKDEEPNVELAQKIAQEEDKEAIQELVSNLHNKNKDIQSDCIKVLYEIGAIKPAIIAEYCKEFLNLLEHKNNRLVWGAMTALDSIALEKPDLLYSELPRIIDAANKGSVIVKDHAVGVLIKLCSLEAYANQTFLQLIEQLKGCPTNQLPMYAENAIPIINMKNKALFTETLLNRLIEIEKISKRKRVEKVIKKLS
jgi:hypothetical protein